MKKVLILPLVVLTFSTSAIATEAPIDKMFSVMAMDKQITGGFEAMLPVIDQMNAQFKLDANGKEELKEIFRTWFNEDIDHDKMLSEMKTLYLQAFSEQEIIEITAFYQTPVGKKFLKVSDQLMQKGAKIGMREAQIKQGKLMARVQPFLEKHGIKK